MSMMEEIHNRAQAYARAHETLRSRIEALEAEKEALVKRRLPGIRAAVRQAAEARDQLAAAIESAPELFVKPRTQVVSGIRIGIQKGKGKLIIDDPARTVSMIKKRLPEKADDLIAVKEAPIKKALANLSASELKKIGVTIQETGDEIVIKPTDSDVEKLVNALLKEAEEWTTE